MTYSKKQTFSRTRPVLILLMLMFARVSTSIAAVPQESGGAQAPSTAEQASGSVIPRVIQSAAS